MSEFPVSAQLFDWVVQHIVSDDANLAHLFDTLIEQDKVVHPTISPETRYHRFRTQLDASAQRKDLYHGKHPAIDNRKD